MFGPRVTVATVRGIAVELDLSWLIIGALVAWSVAHGPLTETSPPLTEVARWSVGVLGALALLVSVVLHELGHALVAARFGVRTRRITLFLFGGVAALERAPPSPRAELVISLAGPVVSGLLALLGMSAHLVLDELGLAAAAVLARYVGWLNSSLAIFNLVPAFPLDGGRVLRALLWARGRSSTRATEIAAALGSAFGALLVGGGLLSFLLAGEGSGLWLVLLGLFLRQAAQGAPRAEAADRALRKMTVGELVKPTVVVVPADLSLARFVDDVVLRAHHRIYPVVDDAAEPLGREAAVDRPLLGVVAVRALIGVERDQWSSTPVRAIMAAPSEKNTISVAASARDALLAMEEHDTRRLVVVDGARVRGVLTARDLALVLPLVGVGPSDEEG